MATAHEYLQRLSRYPHRGTATAEEAAAARELAGWLQAFGYAVSIQRFRAPRDTLYLGPSAVMLGVVLAGALGLWMPWLAVLLCGALLAPMVGEMLGSSRLDFDRILPKYPSQNVIARRAPADPVQRTLVITAHYDTQRASLLFHPRVAPYLPAYFGFVYLLLLLMPLLLTVRFLVPEAGWTGTALLALAGLLLANAAFLLLCWRTGGYINGANDNGTGTALALALAERFAATGLPGTELIFVLTGAEEVGTRGIKAYVRSCGLDPARTQFINLDNLGGGRLHYLLGEGMLVARPYCRSMVMLASQMAAELDGQVRSKPNLLLPTDGLIPSLAGYPAITFIAFDDTGVLPDYHWYTDTLERVDPALLAFVERFLLDYVHRLAGVPVTMEGGVR